MKTLKKTLKIILYTATVFLFIFPIWLYLIGANELETHRLFLNKHCWQWWIISLGVIVIIINIILIHLNDSHQLNSFKNEVFYLFKNGKPAWILGLAISNIIIALYFFIPTLSKVDRFDASFGIFLGILAIFLGIHILYEKDAPLIGTMSLLEKLNKDLVSFKGGNLYFVFPALNFGFYTESIINKKTIFSANNGNPTFYKDTSLAADLFIELHDIKTLRSNKCVSKSKAIVFDDEDANDKNYVEKLYMTYHYMISKEDECQSLLIAKNNQELKQKIESLKNNESVQNCVKSAKLITSLFDVIKVKPNELIQPVIVIGNIVYLIADYGMPIFDETKNYFVPLKKEGQPVELICWRRTDAALAKQIVNHIDKFIETKTNNNHTP